jgi:Ca-activated chloride channel family protein
MRFASPQVLWLLVILVGPLVLFLWFAWRRRQELIQQFISSRLLAQLKVGVSPARQKARLVIIVAAVVFIILALAAPEWGVTNEEVRQRGLDIVVAIDTSNSMLAEDTPPNRLARAKLAALDLMRRAKSDRLALIAFAGSAFLECPLTLDDAAFSQSVNALDTNTISQGGTAVAEAINEARKTFSDESDNHKVLVIFSDGEDHDSDALEAAKRAAKEGMIIFTVGIGTPEGAQLRLRDNNGHVDYIRDEDGKPVLSKLNDELLKELAATTKEGLYVPLRGTKTMDALYDERIAPLPKREGTAKLFQRYHEQFKWPLGIAMGLLLLETFLPERKRRRTSRSAATPAPSALVEAAVILCLALLPFTGLASPGSALREYNAGKYDDALNDYKKLGEKKDDPRLHFNAGDSAYQSHHLEDAMKEFNQALISPDLNLQQRSYYNLGNTLYRLGEEIKDPDKKKEAWENAVQQFESALKLNQQDPDAKFNQEFVKKQLEELKKQQQQQSRQNKDKNQKQNQDQKDQQNKSQDQNQQSQDKPQDQNQKSQDKSKPDQNSQAKNQDKQKSEDQKKSDDKSDEQAGNKKQEKQDAQKPDKPDQQDQASAAKEKEKAAEEAKQEAAMMAAGQMTPKQAEQMLDSEKDEDRVFQIAPPNKNTSLPPAYKNW